MQWMVRFGRYLQVATLVAAALSTVGCGAESVSAGKARLPSGVVDWPQPNQTITARFTASGWAVSDDQIQSVSVYMDLSYLMDCKYGIARPDVAKFLNITGENVGWSVDLDLPPGKHELVFAAQTRKGAIRDLGIVPITVVHP